MKKRITLFLDIDGVLIPAKPWEKVTLDDDGYSVFHPLMVNNLNKLLEKGSFDIILSSARREKIPINKFNEFFKNRQISQKIVKYTPPASPNKNRKQEIEEYIINNNIKRFLILDDDKSLNDLPHLFKKYLVLTKPMIGFNRPKLYEALEKIGFEEDILI